VGDGAAWNSGGSAAGIRSASPMNSTWSPACWLCRAPRYRGSPPGPALRRTVGPLASAKRSATALAKRRDSPTWASDSTLIAKWLAARKADSAGLAERSDHSTSGGSSESELKELAVRPTARPSASRQVAIVTPVVKRPSVLRRALASNGGMPPMVGPNPVCAPPGFQPGLSARRSG
jgi:hypothetical protein